MSDSLYGEAIKALAARGPGSLPEPHAAATLDNPLCGDRVTVEVRLEDGRVTAVGHRVSGCLLCRASASALSERVGGMEAKDAGHLADEVRAMLKAEAEPPFAALAVFLPVRAHKSRHDCVLLPFNALAKALQGAR